MLSLWIRLYLITKTESIVIYDFTIYMYLCFFNICSGSVEEEVDFGLEDILPAVSRAAKNGRKKKNDLELENLKKKTTVKSLRYTALDLSQVSFSHCQTSKN